MRLTEKREGGGIRLCCATQRRESEEKKEKGKMERLRRQLTVLRSISHRLLIKNFSFLL